jgi:formylmethanofuran dehydrogenase subunit E
MHSRWGMVDSLMREIGALRNEVRGVDPGGLDARIVAEVDRCIADAAQAIDETIAGPEDEDGLIGACVAIVVARDRIEALRVTLKKSGRAVERSVAQRRQAGRQLYESLKARAATPTERGGRVNERA